MRLSRSSATGASVAGALCILAAVAVFPLGGGSVGGRFFGSLRIAKPKVVAAAAPGAGNPTRQLQNTVAGILAETTSVAVDEADTSAPNIAVASAAAGIPARSISARTDSAAVTVLGAHRLTLRVNRQQLETLLKEAGRPARVDDALNGSPVSLDRGRGVREEYGHCPAAVANTLQSQIQGPPPPSTDNNNCVFLVETPLAAVSVPVGLDTAAVIEIALELNGLSPKQAGDFRSLFDWRAALAITLPRGIRSYEIVNVAGTRGMLMLTAGRREATYMLIWSRDGAVNTLSGYGNSGDARSLAESVR
ncbi:MAG: hypothetical protein ABI442_02970 [Gemmatimonadaceae bacterium]